MAAITDIYKNTPIAIAVGTILIITAIFYIAGVPTSTYDKNIFNNNTIVISSNEPSSLTNFESTPMFTVEPQDAIAYIINYPSIGIYSPPDEPITTVPYMFFTIYNFTRRDYIASHVYEYYAIKFKENQGILFNELITGNPYILPDTHITEIDSMSLSTDSNNFRSITIYQTLEVTISPDKNSSYFISVDTRNAFSIAPDAYEHYAVYENMYHQGSMVGFYKDYLKWDISTYVTQTKYFILPDGMTIVSNGSTTTKYIFTGVYLIAFASSPETTVHGNTHVVQEYPLFLVDHTFTASIFAAIATMSHNEDNLYTMYYPIVVTSDGVIESSPDNATDEALQMLPHALSLASYYAFIENYWGVAAPSFISLDYNTSYYIGNMIIPSHVIMSQLYYSYVDYFFSKTAFYNYTALDFEPWKGFLYAPDSVKAKYIYYASLPPVFIPKTAYSLNGILFTATNSFYITTEVKVKSIQRNDYTAIIQTTKSIYNTGTLAGNITLVIPFKYGELWKQFTIYIFETNPNTTITSIINITGKYTSSNITVVIPNVLISLDKPDNASTVVTFGVGVVVHESYPAAPLPPIEGTNFIFPKLTSETKTEFVEFYVSAQGYVTSISIPIKVLKVYATGFDSTPISSNITTTVIVTHFRVLDDIDSYATPITTTTTVYFTSTDEDGNTKKIPMTTFFEIKQHADGMTEEFSFSYITRTFTITFNLDSYLNEYKQFARTFPAKITSFSLEYDGENFKIKSNVVNTNLSDTIIRNDFVTFAKVFITLHYSTSETSTTTTVVVTSTATAYDPEIGKTITSYTVYYTLHETTIYYTTISNVYLASGEFKNVDYNYNLGNTDATKIDTSMVKIPESMARTQLKTLLFIGEILATKPLLYQMNFMPAEANNYINVAEIRDQFYLGPFEKTKDIVINYTSTFSYRSPTKTVITNDYRTVVMTSFTTVTTTIIYQTVIPFIYGKNVGYENSLRALVLKAPRSPGRLFKTILNANYPLLDAGPEFTYSSKIKTAIFDTTTLLYPSYYVATDGDNRIDIAAVLETYMPGKSAPIFVTDIYKTTSLDKIELSVVINGHRIDLGEITLKIPKIISNVYSNVGWYPPIDFLVSSLDYGIAAPVQYSYMNFYYVETFYDAFSSTNITVNPSIVFDVTITSYSIDSDKTITLTSISKSTVYLYMNKNSTTAVMSYTINEIPYPPLYLFAVNPNATETALTTTSPVNESTNVYITYTVHKFIDSRIAVPIITELPIIYVITSGTITIVTSTMCPNQLFSFPTNPNYPEVANDIVTELDSYLDDTNHTPTLVFDTETITLMIQNPSELPWFVMPLHDPNAGGFIGYYYSIYLPPVYRPKPSFDIFLSFTTYSYTVTETYTVSYLDDEDNKMKTEVYTETETITTVRVIAKDITRMKYTMTDVSSLSNMYIFINDVSISASYPYAPIRYFANNVATYVTTIGGMLGKNNPFFYAMFVGHPKMRLLLYAREYNGLPIYIPRIVVMGFDAPEPYPFTPVTYGEYVNYVDVNT